MKYNVEDSNDEVNGRVQSPTETKTEDSIQGKAWFYLQSVYFNTGSVRCSGIALWRDKDQYNYEECEAFAQV